MSKSPDAFRTISEVADWLGVQAHVLRFWESRFTQVKPVKRAGGRRYYRPNDMRLLGGIKKLLHEDGITIKGVQRILREQGVAHVASLSPSLEEHSPAPAEPVEDTVVPFEPKTAPVTEQIHMDLGEPSEPLVKEDAQINDAPTANAKPVAEPELDAAPLMGGITSLAWNRAEFDDDLLRRIAPIAKDLRHWLDRVETQATG
ncbi:MULTISPECIES: MerR family transcriptional regulator [unclassified Ruegeria]|uniref:MerR family transcriptional regulator n=1 Tax=unclassified Ruegeria TaxID=2625375 RepID=UPI001489BC7D|nr:MULTISPECIES: MerR family transcriptional regulator [unclassified Ruegeria]NOD78083.1 MerR family transcriptional regulator [Ruegeria sp. HKCCD4332]NOD87667.1 MerR family transcriptional regulator [Ruegeria sp. HKCCD4318]NOD91763.1 MerR family transcriptional regulator [Ruegeria sp. HKCCD4884]NOE15700.1 MerR family transcriptional regulator [Ruegeria sp. HKCCD4318-2]NOG08608.1 MerR family transcriptional regulator [Ruegeria sp. HKCCD4315]